MNPSQQGRTLRRCCAWQTALVCAGCCSVAIALQLLNGAYRSEFGSEPDEAAHYVTGLCVRDYLVVGLPGSPLRFARDYYEHYPKVALGHWPPFFYALQTAWTLPLGASRLSILVFMAVLTAATATLLFAFLERQVHRPAAVMGALLFLSLPLVQRFSAAVMTEIPMALLTWLAMNRWARFLEQERRRDAVAFGALAGIAILTKFSGLVLGLAAPLALLFTGKLGLLRSANLWLAAGVTAALAGPWTAATVSLAKEGMTGERWGWDFTHRAAPYYAEKFYGALGAGLLVFVVAGLGARVVGPLLHRPGAVRAQGVSTSWASLAGLLAGVLLLHLIVPTGREARHLVPALAPALALALGGASAVADWLRSGVRTGRLTGLAGMLVFGTLLLAYASETFRLQPKGYAGFGAVAETIAQQTRGQPARVMVCSDARGEGMLIAEVAMREQRPGSWVKRASKAMASSSWSGADYRLKFRDAAELEAFLAEERIEFVVVDWSVPRTHRRAHHDLMERTVSQSARFRLLGRFPLERQGAWQAEALGLYRFE